MQAAKSFAPFRRRLMLLILLIVLPCFGLILWASLEQRRLERENVREQAIAVSRLAAAYENNLVDNARQILTVLSQIEFLVSATDRQAIAWHFANLRRLLPDYSNFGLIETNGTLFCSAETNSTPVYLGDRTYFLRAVKTKQFASGDFQISRTTGEQTLNFAYPVTNQRGQVVRVLYASLKISRLSDVINNISLPPGATVTLFDRAGTVAARRPDTEKWIGHSLSNAPVVQHILSGGGGVFEMQGVGEVPSLHAVTPLRDGVSPGLFIGVEIPVAVSFGPADRALIRNFVILGFVAVLVSFVARYYAKRFVLRPVNALVQTANQLAEGDVNARAGEIGGSRELVKLAHTFDQMAERLQKRQQEIEEANAHIQRMNQELEQRVAARTAQLEMAIKELEAFSYSVSHDLRAPLRHIDGFVGMFTRDFGGKLDGKGHRYLNIIAGSARQMADLIDDLLVFSRMGRSELRWTTLNLSALVHEIVERVRHEQGERAVDWKIAELPVVHADPAMLQLVIMNLVSNAFKYTRSRNPAVIEIRCTTETPEEFVFCVQDNGVGFDMRYAHKLFGVFQRLHRMEEFEGTGIGLANVRRIVVRHGGRTWAEGKIDAGATFYFTLPKKPITTEATA